MTRFTYYEFLHIDDSLYSTKHFNEKEIEFYSCTFGSFGAWLVIDNLHEDVYRVSKEFKGIDYIDALAFIDKARVTKKTNKAFNEWYHDKLNECEWDASTL